MNVNCNMNWFQVSMILCIYGFLRTLLPTEPYVVDFLTGEWRNITASQVNREVFPLSTYSHMLQLLIVFLVTDFLRYKPIIILSSVVGIVCFSILLWTSSLFALQLNEIVWSTYSAAEVAYFVYMYAKVDRCHYQQVTSHTRTAVLMGQFVGDVLGQILISLKWMDVRELNYLSLAFQCLSLVVALMLPSVKTSLYFYSHDYNQSTDNERGEDMKPTFSLNKAINLLWKHFKEAYSNVIVIKWSIWWALATCGYQMIMSYSQLLWSSKDPLRIHNFNGAADACQMLLGATMAFSVGLLKPGILENMGFSIMTVCSLIVGSLLLAAALLGSVFVAYAAYILVGGLHHFMITVASTIIAKRLAEDSFALIFGINAFMSLFFQTIFTIVVISPYGFALNSSTQFTVFGYYFLALATIYALMGVITAFVKK